MPRRKVTARRACHGTCFVPVDDSRYIQEECPQQPPCKLQPCPNHAVCGRLEPAWFLDAHANLCFVCDATFGHTFTLFSTQETCPICLEVQEHSVGYTCGHKVCGACFGTAMGVRDRDNDGAAADVLPEDFGFVAPAADGDYFARLDIRDAAMDEWERTHPEQYQRYQYSYALDDDTRRQRLEERRSLLTRCPMCRAQSAVLVRHATSSSGSIPGLQYHAPEPSRIAVRGEGGSVA